jgi:hypothetical protein
MTLERDQSGSMGSRIVVISEAGVPTLFRFLLIVGILAALVYAGMIALVTYVEPQQRDFIQQINPARLNKEK